MPGIRFCCLVTLLLAHSAIAAPTYPFLVETEKTSDGHRVVARNQGPAPVSVRVATPMAVNVTPDRPFPVYAVVPPNGQLIIGSLRATIPGVSYSFQTQSAHILGNFNVRQHPDAQYRLPVRDGRVARIDQAAGGVITTHTSPESQYAVDIPLPEGTPIVAARDGMVIAAEAGQSEGGKRLDLLTKANVVRILHFEGTIGEYAHLAPGGVFVYPGQRVRAGDEIGLAGSTGYSSGPPCTLRSRA